MSHALITGASKGIGKAIAVELAKRKFDLILVARNEQLLAETAKEIAKIYDVKTAYLAIDLSDPTAPKQLLDWCITRNFQVSMLVNNAGYGLSGKFESYALEDNLNMMQLNINSLVALCQLFLPMLKSQPRGYIMNIASSTAYQAIPNMSLYAASKSFVLRFSRGLSHELKNSNVTVTAISPGSTDTDFPTRAGVGEKALKAATKVNMTAEAVAKIAVVATLSGKREAITGFINKVGAFMAWLLPRALVEKTAGAIYED